MRYKIFVHHFAGLLSQIDGVDDWSPWIGWTFWGYSIYCIRSLYFYDYIILQNRAKFVKLSLSHLLFSDNTVYDKARLSRMNRFSSISHSKGHWNGIFESFQGAWYGHFKISRRLLAAILVKVLTRIRSLIWTQLYEKVKVVQINIAKEWKFWTHVFRGG